MRNRSTIFSPHRKTSRQQVMIITSAIMLTIITVPCLGGQDVDPFYMKLFREGEAAFQSQKYKDSIKSLEVAVFGLSKDRALAGKADVYMALSHYHLKNFEKCGQYLAKAYAFLGDEGIKSLEIDKSTRSLLDTLLISIKPEQAQRKPVPAFSAEPKAEKEGSGQQPSDRLPSSKTVASRLKELNESLKSDPENVFLYYELHDLHRRKSDLDAAKRALKGLLRITPDDTKAVFLLARTEFFLKNYADASEGFNMVLRPSSASSLDKSLALKSTIYLSLCLHYQKNRESLKSYLENLSRTASVVAIRQALVEEGLEKEWDRMAEEMRKSSARRK